MSVGLLCGWRVDSDLPLPELASPGDGPLSSSPADLAIRLGPVPDSLADPVFAGPLLQVGRDGSCRYAVPGVAAYHVDPAGTVVTVAPSLADDDPAVRTFLFGTVFAVLCRHRGLLPLHACCLRLDGPDGPVAVAFAGPSGVGKSTLAAEFRRQGHAVLADDVTVLRSDAAGRAQVLPGPARLKLWRDSLDRLGWPAEGLQRVRSELEKFVLPAGDGPAPEPLPLAAVYHLARVNDSRHGGVARLRGMPAVLHFLANIYRDRTLARFEGGKAALLARATRLAAAVPQHWTLARVLDYAALPDLAAELARRTAAGESG